jgi:26S proteasome regulatory subunit T1
MEYILTEILKNAFRATVEHNRYNHYHHNHGQQPQPQPQHSNDGSGSGSGPIAHTHHQEQHLPLPPVLITIVPPPRLPGVTKLATLSLRIRDQGGGVAPGNMERIFSYAFTTAGRRSSSGSGGGPYAAQQHVGAGGAVAAGGVDFFGEITSKGIETGLGTIAGLGFGLPMSRLYAQ